jgi:polyisoprenoid-binding protein YceI
MWRRQSTEEAINTNPATIAFPTDLAGTWKADPVHSEIGFSVRLMALGKARGRFTSFDITIVTGADPFGSSVAATIELASIDTGNQRRDKHLRSAAFLAVDEHPTMNYRSTGIRHTDEGWVIDGSLTLHNFTQQVPLSVAAVHVSPDTSGGRRARFAATAQLSRGEFGIDAWTYGGTAVGDKVSISLEIEAARQD